MTEPERSIAHAPPEDLLADPVFTVLLEVAPSLGVTPEWVSDLVVQGWDRGVRPLRSLLEAGVQRTVLQSILWAKRGYETVELSSRDIDMTVALQLPTDMARRHCVLPYKQEGETVWVVMSDPMDLSALDILRQRFPNSRFEKRVADQAIIQVLINQVEAQRGSETETALATELAGSVGGGPALDEDDTSDSMIARLLGSIVERAVAERASDIHIESSGQALRIRYRIDGVLATRATHKPNLGPPLMNYLKVQANLDMTERRRPQDGRIVVPVGERRRKVVLRLVVVPTSSQTGGEKAVLRILDKREAEVRRTDLGLSGHVEQALNDMTGRSNGVILVSGPTGSGKTTTLYAVLTKLAQDDVSVYTIEHPVEYPLDKATQIEINPKIGFGFAEAATSLLRADPDVMLIGEIRDPETARVAIQASDTGHLVLSTVHANSASSTPVRLIEMGVEPYLVCSALRGVLAQRLIRRLCENCKLEDEIPDDIIWPGERPAKIYTHHSDGCAYCGFTGYRGRMAVAEALMVNDKIRLLIAERADAQRVEEAAKESGMLTLYQDALLKVAAGITSLSEAHRVKGGAL